MAITKVGESSSYSYNGGVQTFTAPIKGLYKLEAWGAKGNGGVGGKGGYTVGYKELNVGDVLYICCGGNANSTSKNYNGGGGGRSGATGYGGGGATHIALVTGTLADIGKTNFVSNKKGLIVAGGGGGARYANSTPEPGGTGGGTSGTAGVSDGHEGKGGTQSAGGYGKTEDGAFGVGGDGDYGGGGGGGLYGGGANQSGGGGGSGYIGGVSTITYNSITYAPSTRNGVNTGTGKALITLIATEEEQLIEYEYTGTVQTFKATEKGLYKLEAWGASGFAPVGDCPSGGYSYGYIVLNKDTELYIAVGGMAEVRTGGWNGGGNGGTASGYTSSYVNGGGGGGATHISKVQNRGTLSSYSDNRDEVVLVAGGSGGGAWLGTATFSAGAGGGTSGGNGSGRSMSTSAGTQTTGYSFGSGQTAINANGSSYGESGRGGGGGGWYGGNASQTQANGIAGGAGGSGYIGGIPEIVFKGETYPPGTELGKKQGHGKVAITYIAKGIPTIYKGDLLVDALYKGALEVDDIKT